MASKRDVTIKKRRGRAVEERPEKPERSERSKTKSKPRRRRQRSVLWPMLFRLLLVTAVVMLGVLLWRNWDRLAPAALTEWVDHMVTGGDGGDGYPVDITGSSVVTMKPFGANAAILTDTSLLLYNTGGGEVLSRGHTYTDPLLDTAGNYLLMSELGGTRYTLGTKKETVFSGQAAGNIVSAAVSQNGRVALATESSQSYMSEVLVLDREGEKVFHWYSADLTVVDVAFHPNGKQIAVLGLSATGGEMKSTLHIFSLSGKEQKATHTYSATGFMMVALSYFNNGNIAAVGDTALWVYDPDKNEAKTVTYTEAALLGYAFSERGVSVAVRGYGESSGGALTVVTPAGEKTAEVLFDGDFRHLAGADNGFYLLTDDTLYNADTVGFAKKTPALPDGLMTVEMNGKPLILGLTSLSRCEWKEATA